MLIAYVNTVGVILLLDFPKNRAAMLAKGQSLIQKLNPFYTAFTYYASEEDCANYVESWVLN